MSRGWASSRRYWGCTLSHSPGQSPLPWEARFPLAGQGFNWPFFAPPHESGGVVSLGWGWRHLNRTPASTRGAKPPRAVALGSPTNRRFLRCRRRSRRIRGGDGGRGGAAVSATSRLPIPRAAATCYPRARQRPRPVGTRVPRPSHLASRTTKRRSCSRPCRSEPLRCGKKSTANPFPAIWASRGPKDSGPNLSDLERIARNKKKAINRGPTNLPCRSQTAVET